MVQETRVTADEKRLEKTQMVLACLFGQRWIGG